MRPPTTPLGFSTQAGFQIPANPKGVSASTHLDPRWGQRTAPRPLWPDLLVPVCLSPLLPGQHPQVQWGYSHALTQDPSPRSGSLTTYREVSGWDLAKGSTGRCPFSFPWQPSPGRGCGNSPPQPLISPSRLGSFSQAERGGLMEDDSPSCSLGWDLCRLQTARAAYLNTRPGKVIESGPYREQNVRF